MDSIVHDLMQWKLTLVTFVILYTFLILSCTGYRCMWCQRRNVHYLNQSMKWSRSRLWIVLWWPRDIQAMNDCLMQWYVFVYREALWIRRLRGLRLRPTENRWWMKRTTRRSTMLHPSTGHRGIAHILSLTVTKGKHVLSETCHMMFSINRKTSGHLKSFTCWISYDQS